MRWCSWRSLPLDLGNLFKTAHVTLLSRERRIRKRPHDVGGVGGADDAGPQADDVAVVVADALRARVGVVGHRGAYAFELAGGDADAGARSTDDHTSVC